MQSKSEDLVFGGWPSPAVLHQLSPAATAAETDLILAVHQPRTADKAVQAPGYPILAPAVEADLVLPLESKVAVEVDVLSWLSSMLSVKHGTAWHCKPASMPDGPCLVVMSLLAFMMDGRSFSSPA